MSRGPSLESSGIGPKPKLGWLTKDVFVVDHHYQRYTTSDRSQAVINHIAKHFNWARFQAPTVMPGPKGKYYVIDGQHRVLAAQKCKLVTEIPCYIIHVMSREEAAKNFIAINKDRVSLNPLAIHRAQIAMRDKLALKIEGVCEEADVAICKTPAVHGMTNPRETCALATIKTGLKKYGEAAVIASLMIVPDAYKLAKGMMRSSILKVLMAFYGKRGVKNVNREFLIEILKYNNPRDMEELARREARVKGTTTLNEMLLQLNADYDLLVADNKAIKRKAGAVD